MLNEPVVHQPPPSPRPEAPSLAELLAARPRVSMNDGAPETVVQPVRLDGEPALPRRSPPDFLSRLGPPAQHAGEPASSLQHGVEGPAHPQEQDVVEFDAKVPLLLVHAGQSEGALIQSWMRNVLKGAQPHFAQFQEAVADIVQYHQPHAVLIQFDPGCLDAAVALAAYLKLNHPQIPRLAIGRTRDPSCMLAALRSGVQDFFDVDAPSAAAQQTLQQLITRPPSAASGAVQAPQTAILSARAGLGCSLLAAHLSWYLQTRLTRLAPFNAGSGDVPATGPGSGGEALTSLLIELGTPGGDCAIYLNTPGDFSFTDAVSQQLRLDRRMAQTALGRHQSGLRLLTQPSRSHLSAPAEVEALLKRLSQYFRHIVLDLGAVESPQLARSVLSHANEIWVVCDQSVASVVWTAELLQQIEQIQVARDRVQLIVNRHDPRLELSAEQVARQLKLPLLAAIPECRRELSEVVNQGMLLGPGSRREPYVHAVEKLADHLLAAHHPGMAASETASSKSLGGPVAHHIAGPITGPIMRLLQSIRKH
ncbi:MAG: pilus assembly protein CpaE [Ottowia sp.]|uniref:AAA family ATPase n=1 Tax=Ottowia sp. TaxID=1898956 RepID=UPI003C78BF1E